MLSKAELQRLRSLREKKHRETLGLFVVEGEKVVDELLAANVVFQTIYATAEWIQAHREALPTLFRPTPTSALSSTPSDSSLPAPQLIEISAEDMSRASHFSTPSSVLGIGKIQRMTLPDGALAHGLTLALDGVQDPGNVGTLLRIADWFALDRILLSGDCADLFHQKVINASMGSFARVKTYTASLSTALAGLTVPVLGCDLTGTDVHAVPALRDAVIVIGSEGRGLSAEAKSCITEYVTVPRFGGAESLNAGIAAAIVCDNVRRVQS